MREGAPQQAAAHLVPLFLNLLQLGQHSGHAVLIEVTVLQQRSMFEPQILHLLQVLWAGQVGQAQNPKNPGTSAHLSSRIPSTTVFVKLSLNCLSRKHGFDSANGTLHTNSGLSHPAPAQLLVGTTAYGSVNYLRVPGVHPAHSPAINTLSGNGS